MTHLAMHRRPGNRRRRNQRNSRKRRWFRSGQQLSRQLFLEPLEDRLLLSNGNSPPHFYEAQDPTSMTLRIDDMLDEVEGVDTLRLLLTGTNVQLASVALNAVSGNVQIIGSSGDDTLLLDIDAATMESHLPDGVLFNGSAGTDELIGPDDIGNAWHVSGSGTGDLGGSNVFAFSDVEKLTGGSGEDTLFGPDSDTRWSIDKFQYQSGAILQTGHHTWPWPLETPLTTFSQFEVLHGGNAVNTLDYSEFSTEVSVDLSSGVATGNLTVVNFDNIVAGNTLPHYGPKLTGDEQANVLRPTAGSHATLAGGPGDDRYVLPSQFGVITVVEQNSDDSGQGNDTLDFSAVTEDLTFAVQPDGSLTVSYTGSSGLDAKVTATGVEHLIGGSGINTLDYSTYLGGGVDVDLAAGRATLFPNIIGVLHVIGTTGNDTLLGDSNANILIGGEGDDVIGGGGGVDELNGGVGVDALVEQQDADMTLTNDTFTSDGGMATISGFELVELSGGPTSNVIDATDFTGLTSGTPLAFLNHGAGVRTHGSLSDFEITLVDGTAHAVNLASALTLQDVLDAISVHAQLDAQLTADGTGIAIDDTSVRVDSNVTTITPLNGSLSAADLGLTTVGTPTVLIGAEIPAGRAVLKGGVFVEGRETVPLSLLERGPGFRTSDAEFIDLRGDGTLTALADLNNGDGVDLTGLQITLGDGESVDIDISGAAAVQDVLDAINDAHDDVAAYISSQGRGIVIRDDSDGAGALEITELGGTTAADLGIHGTGDGNYIRGEDISRVAADIRFTFFDGTHVDVDLSGLGSVVEVLDRITAAHDDLSSVVNVDGTGIDIVYTGGGAVMVDNINNSLAATDLGIVGSAGSGLIQGEQIVGNGGSLIRLDGRFDNDTLIGSRGNDRLTGGGGDDTMDGGPGTNTLFETGDVHLKLTDSALQVFALSKDPRSDSADETDALTDLQQAVLIGGDSDNIIDGSTFTLGSLWINGGLGDDWIGGGGRNDILTGGFGIDDIYGGGGTNTLVEEANTRFILKNESLDMGEGTDEQQTISVTATEGCFALAFDDETTVSISHNATADEVRSALGRLQSIGRDNIEVDKPDENLQTWIVTYVHDLAGRDVGALEATSIDLLNGGVPGTVVVTEIDGTGVTDTLTNIHRADLTGGTGDNTLDASAFSGSVILRGGAGNDVLFGSGGADVLSGGAGNDKLTGGTGHDNIDGGPGIDTLVEMRDAHMILQNDALRLFDLAVDPGMGSPFEWSQLAGIEIAELTGGANDNIIDASAFTGVSTGTPLPFLNGGSGVRLSEGMPLSLLGFEGAVPLPFAGVIDSFAPTPAGTADIKITLTDGETTALIDLGNAKTLQDVLDAINGAHEYLFAGLNEAGTSIVIGENTNQDGSVAETLGDEDLTVEAINGSTAALDLHCAGIGRGGLLVGDYLVSTERDLRVTLSDGSTQVDITLRSAATLRDVLDVITSAHESLTATYDMTLGSVILSDSTAERTSRLRVESLNSSHAASDLGILGEASVVGGQLIGQSLWGGHVMLVGDGGADTLRGTVGDDTFTGGDGADEVLGNDGTDTIVETRAADVDFTLRDVPGDPPSDDAVLIIGSEGTDTLTSVEQATLTGGNGGDQAQLLDASGFTLGPVTLATGGGTDTLKGSSHADRFKIDVSDGTVFTDPTANYVQVFVNGGVYNEVAVVGTPQSASQMDFDWIKFISASGTPADPTSDSAMWTFTGLKKFDVSGTLDTGGLSVKYQADTINVLGGEIYTAGGDITLAGLNITVNDGAVLDTRPDPGSAKQAGNITLQALDELADSTGGQGFYNADFASTTITVGTSGAATHIYGGEVTLEASAANAHEVKATVPENESRKESGIFSKDYWAAKWSDMLASFKESDASEDNEATENLGGFSLLFSWAKVTSTASINVGADAVVQADDFFADARTHSTATAAPSIYVLGASVGQIHAEARLEFAGELTTTGTATFMSSTDNQIDVRADCSGKAGVGVAVALSLLDSDAETHIKDSALLHVGGDLLIQAQTTERNRTSAQADAGDDGKLGISAAYALEHGDTRAWLDGSATVGGSIDVTAHHAEADAGDDGVSAASIVSAGDPPTSEEQAAEPDQQAESSYEEWLKEQIEKEEEEQEKQRQQQDAQAGDQPTSFMEKVKKFCKDAVEWISDAVDFHKAKKDKSPPANKFDFGAAVAIHVDRNSAESRIGDGMNPCDVNAGGQVFVTSTAASRPNVTAAAESEDKVTKAKKESVAGFGGSVAVAVGLLANEADAHIADNASVDTSETLRVEAQALNKLDPTQLWGYNLVAPLLDANRQADHQYNGDQASTPVTIVEGQTVDTDDIRYRFLLETDTLGESIDLAQENYQDIERWEHLGVPELVVAQQYIDNILAFLSSNHKLDSQSADTWSQATCNGQKLAIAGAATTLITNHTATATIESGARINQDAGLVVPGDVVVKAESINHSVILAGNLPEPELTFVSTDDDQHAAQVKKKGGTTVSLADKLRPAGSSSAPDGTGAVGVTGMYFFTDGDAIATIEDGASVAADNLTVKADNQNVTFAVGASGGHSDNFALNGSVVINVLDHDTLAQIENDAIVDIGGDTTVAAHDNSHLVTLSGALANSQRTGIGGSVAWNHVARNTQGVVGNLDDGNPENPTHSLTFGGNTAISARNEGFLFGGSIAGAIAAQDQNSSKQEKDPFAIAVALSNNIVEDAVQAYMNDAIVQSSGDVTINAQFDPVFEAFSIGGGLATGATQGTALAGAAAINNVEARIASYIERTDLTADGSLHMESLDGSAVLAQAGAVSVAWTKGKPASPDGDKNRTVSVGLSYAANFVGSQHSVLCYIDESDVETGGPTDLDARSTALVHGLAVGGALAVTTSQASFTAKDDVVSGAGAGALVMNTVEQSMRAFVRNSSVVSKDATDDSIIVNAAHEPDLLRADAFGVAAAYAEANGRQAAAEGISVGVAIALNTVEQDVEAIIQDSTVTTNGSLLVHALANPNVYALAVGIAAALARGAGSSLGGSGAGSIATNQVTNKVRSQIRKRKAPGSSVTAKGDVTVNAEDSSFLRADAGAFSVALSQTKAGGSGSSTAIAVGASLAKNTLGDGMQDEIGILDPNLRHMSPYSTLTLVGDKTAKVYLWDQEELTPNAPTYVVTHGWRDSVEPTAASQNVWQLEMAPALRERFPTSNILLVDWNALSRNLNYIQAAEDTDLVGDALGEYLYGLAETDQLDPAHTTLIGHSLGAHVSGNAADEFERLSGEQLDTVIGLDPAGPLFEKAWPWPGIPADRRLDDSDAERVVAIHSTTIWGFDDELGHLDIYCNPDDGHQPASSASTTDHSYAYHLLTQLIQGTAFPQANDFVVGEALDFDDITVATGRTDTVTFVPEGWDAGHTVKAQIIGSVVNADGNILVDAHANGLIESLGMGGGLSGTQNSSSSGSAVALTGAGSATTNTIFQTVDASIKSDSNVTTTPDAGGNIAVTAIDTSSIVADAGGVAVSVALKKRGAGTTASGSLGVGVAQNSISSNVDATIDHSRVVADGSVVVHAWARPRAGQTFEFTSDDVFEDVPGGYMYIDIGDHDLKTGDLVVYHNSGDAGEELGGLTDGQTYFVTRQWENWVCLAETATKARDGELIPLQTATAGKHHSLQRLDDSVNAFALGVAVSATSSRGTGLTGALAGAGSVSKNTVDKNVRARILDASGDARQVSATTGGVTVDATDATTIVADSGGYAVALAGNWNSGTTGSGAVGASVTTNEIGKGDHGHSVIATIDNSKIEAAAAGVAVAAISSGNIDTLGIGGALAGTSSSKGSSGALAGGGSITRNNIDTDVETTITSGTTVSTTNGGDVTIQAIDASEIFSESIGAALAASFAGSSSFSAAIGVALADNRIRNNTEAFINTDGSAQTPAPAAPVAASGSILVTAASDSSIRALAAAVSLSLAVAKSNTLALSGGGVGAQNTILGKTNAYLSDTPMVSAGADVTITTLDTARIDARVIAASASVAFGSSIGASVSVGTSVARNYVGWDPAFSSVSPDYLSTDEVEELENGDTVEIVGGVRDREIYTYVGEDNTRYQYLETNTNVDLEQNDLVKVIAGSKPGIYRYRGESQNDVDLTAETFWSEDGEGDWVLVDANDLSATDFGDTNLWKQTHLGLNAAEVQALVGNSTITAGGDVTLEAASEATITSLVLAGSVAIGASKKLGIALGGAGVSTENRIKTLIRACVDNSSLVTAQHVGLSAVDAPMIKADAGAAAIAGAFGSTAGVSIAVGVALAVNEVSNEVEAAVEGSSTVTATAADGISLNASVLPGGAQTPTWNSDSGTRSLAPGQTVRVASDHEHGGQAGRAYKYRGAVPDYTLNGDSTVGTVLLHEGNTVQNGDNVYRYQGDDEERDLTAENYSSEPWLEVNLDRRDLSQENYSNTKLWELADATIAARSAAASLAFAGAGKAAVSLAGAGARSTNRILTKTNAFVANSELISAGDIELEAASASKIAALVGAVSISVGGGGNVGVGASIGVSIAENEIGWDGDARTPAEVQAYVSESQIDAAGILTLDAHAADAIDAMVLAGSAALALGGTAGVGLSGAGVSSTNRIAVDVKSFIAGNGPAAADNADIVADAVVMRAIDSSHIDSMAGAASIAGGLGGSIGVAVSVGVSLAENHISNVIESYIVDETVKTTGAPSNDPQTPNGNLILIAGDDSTVTSICAAASVSIGAGGSAGVAVSGAGAVARNIILTKANAHIDSSEIVSSGTVALDATSDSRIDATIVAASAGVGVGGYAGVGASVGFAIARNYIGWDPTLVSSDYDALAERQYLNQGETVKVTNGDRAGDVYEYVGDSRTRWDYEAKGVRKVKAGDLIKVDPGRTVTQDGQEIEIPAGIYQSTTRFPPLPHIPPIDLSSQTFSGFLHDFCEYVAPDNLSAEDYADEAVWQQVNPTDDAAEIQASVLDSDVTAAGDLALRAESYATIDAFVLSGSVTIGASGVAGVSASGAGTIARNKVNTRVRSLIKGQLADGHSAAGISLIAYDSTTIDADVIGASISGAVGGIAGVAFSIGVSLAQNEVGNDVEAFIKDCSSIVATTDVIVLDARTLPGTTEPADYQSATTGEIGLQAGDTVQVAEGHTAGGSVGRIYRYRGYADYVSTDKNVTGFTLQIQPGCIVKKVDDSKYYEFVGTEDDGENITSLSTENYENADRWRLYKVNLNQQDYSDYARWELADATISTRAVAASFALSVGGVAGVSVSGAGAVAQNVITSKTNAYIEDSNVTTTANDDGQMLDSDGDVVLVARNDSSISAIVGALSAAVGAGIVGVGVSIGVASAENLIGHQANGQEDPQEIGAYIAESHVDAAGDLVQNALSTQSIAAEVVAGSAAVATGLAGVAGSGAGTSAANRIFTDVTAYLDDQGGAGETAISADSITLTADDSSEIHALTGTASLAASFGYVGVSVSIGIATARNEISNVIEAFIDGAGKLVETADGDVTVEAREKATIGSQTAAASLAIGAGFTGIALSGAGAMAENRILTNTGAYITNCVLSSAEDVTVEARSTSTIDAIVISAAASLGVGFLGAGAAIGRSEATNQIGDVDSPHSSHVLAYISNSEVEALGNLSITAMASQTINATITGFAVALGYGAKAKADSQTGAAATNSVGTQVLAYMKDTIGDGAAVDDSVTILAKDMSRVNADVGAAAIAAAAGWWKDKATSLAASEAIATVGNAVEAYIESATVSAGSDLDDDLSVEAVEEVILTTSSVAAAEAGSTGLFSTSTAYGAAEATGEVKTEAVARVDQATMSAGRDLTVRAAGNIDTDVDVGTSALSAGFAAGGSKAEVQTAPTITATIGPNCRITATSGNVLVEAFSKLNADTNAYGVSNSGLFAIGASEATAIIQPKVTAEVKSGTTVEAGNNITVKAIHNIGNDAPITASSAGSAGTLVLADAGATSEVELHVAVNATVDDGASLGITDEAVPYDHTAITIAADAYNWADVNATGNSKGLIATETGYGINAFVDTNAEVTTTIGDSVRIGQAPGPQPLPDQVDVSAKSVMEVTGMVLGEAGQTLKDAILDRFTSGLPGFFDNSVVTLPSVYANGGALLDVGITNLAQTIIEENALIDATHQVNVTADAETVANGIMADHTSKAAFKCDGIAAIDVTVDSDAVVEVGDSAAVTSKAVVIRAVNTIDVDANATAKANATWGAAYVTGISRVVIGTDPDVAANETTPSEARVTVGEGANITGLANVTLEAQNYQPGDAAKSLADDEEPDAITSTAIADSHGLAKAKASALAAGTIDAESTVESKSGSSMETDDLSVHAESNYTIKRDPQAEASTTLEAVTDYIRKKVVKWLPWPLNKLVKWILTPVTRWVEKLSETEASVIPPPPEDPVALDDKIDLNGDIRSFKSTNRSLTINDDGNGGIITDGNVAAAIHNHEILVDDIVNDHKVQFKFQVPNGHVGGNALLHINNVVPNVTIENHTNFDLVLGGMQLLGNGPEEQEVQYDSQNDFDFRIDPKASSNVNVDNNGLGDIIFSESIGTVSAIFDIHNTDGDILQQDDEVVLETCERGTLAGETFGIRLTADQGSIGSAARPFHVRLIRGLTLSDGTPNPTGVTVDCDAYGDIFLLVSGVLYTSLEPDESRYDVLDGIAIDAFSSHGTVQVAEGESKIIDVRTVEEEDGSEGHTEESESEADETDFDFPTPVQQVTANSYNRRIRPGQDFGFTLRYGTSDGNSSLNGVGLRIHYDSGILVFNGFADILGVGLLDQQPQPIDDADDFDSDATTDKFVLLAWADEQSNWPDATLPVTLAAFGFTLRAGTSLGTTSDIRITASSSDPAYEFSAPPVTVQAVPVNLDVDDDGELKDETDGMLMMKYMFGFRDGSIIPSDIVALLDQAESADPHLLNPDGSESRVGDALSDGILIRRYLQYPGSEHWKGQDLIQDALVPNDPIFVPPPDDYWKTIWTFLDSFNPMAPKLTQAPALPEAEGDPQLFTSHRLSNATSKSDGTTLERSESEHQASVQQQVSSATTLPPLLSDSGLPVPTIAAAGTANDSVPAAEPGNVQIVSPSPLHQVVEPGEPVLLHINYSTDPDDPSLTGLGLRIHYDSTILSFDSLNDALPGGFVGYQDPVDDTASDYDHDPSTDKYVLISWADPDGQWPGTIPVQLCVVESFSSEAASGSTQINFTTSSTAADWTLDATSAVVAFDRAPSAAADTIYVERGEIATVLASGATSLLDNDTDQDLPNDTLIVDTNPVSGPAHGFLTLNPDGTFSYHHDGSENTRDQFEYRVVDQAGQEDRATVTVHVKGDFSVHGFAYADTNRSGAPEHGEGIPDVLISLTGPGVNRETWADEHGWYEFRDLPSGSYTVTERQPHAFIDGGENIVTDVTPAAGEQAVRQDFWEVGLKPQYVFNRFYANSTLPTYSDASHALCKHVVDTAGVDAHHVPSESPQPAQLVEREGAAVIVRGTNGNDHFEFTAAASLNDQHRIVLNDTPYEFPAAEISSILFEGGLGKDTATMSGSTGAEQLEASFNWASMQSPTYVVELTSTEIMSFDGGEGTAKDTAELIDSVLDDTLLGTFDLVRLNAYCFHMELRGFEDIIARSQHGGVDRKSIEETTDYLLQTDGLWEDF